jgi:dihydrofolate reductase
MISIIACIDSMRGIGKNNQLLFHIPEDMRRFRTITMGKTIVMGYNTAVSLPNRSPLKGRRNMVISNNHTFLPLGFELTNIDEVISKYENSDEEIFVIGGASIYKQLLPYTKKLYLTEVQANDITADTYFPDINTPDEKWLLDTTTLVCGSHNGVKYTMKVYNRDESYVGQKSLVGGAV